MISVTILGLAVSIFALFPTLAGASCADAEQMKADIRVMKNHDRSILKAFYEKNNEALRALEKEADDAIHLVRQRAVNGSPEIVNWAKNVRQGGQHYSVPIDERMIGAQLNRILPEFLYKNWFFQESNLTGSEGRMGPIHQVDKRNLRDMEIGYVQSGFYVFNVRRMKRSPLLITFEPMVQIPGGSTGLVINQSFPARWGKPEVDRRSWEVEVHYSFFSDVSSTELPPTQIYGGNNRKDHYRVEFQTVPKVLDLATGGIRQIREPDVGFELLDAREPSVGFARVTSDYMQQRWQMERALEQCR